MRHYRLVPLPILIALAAALPLASQQPRVVRGAVAGGVAGATLTGLAGALLATGVCDAADCSDAWIDGVVPGVVLGGFGGALIGAGLGAVLGGDDGPASSSGARWIPAALLDFSAARTESESVDRGTSGARLMIGARRGGLTVGPSYGYLRSNTATVASTALALRLEQQHRRVRPFAEVETGRFSWRTAGVIPTCQPGTPPNCTYRQGTIRDAYLGVAGAVGIAFGDPDGRWAVHAQVRYHHSGSRPTGEPGSTTTRQLRQATLGASLALGHPFR